MTTPHGDAGHRTPLAELVRAYLDAVYRWRHDDDWHDLSIGLPAPALELLYPEADTFGMLSAWNPRSVERSEAVNREADARLHEELAATGLAYLPAFGSAADRSWREPGWVVVGMALDDFDALSRRHGQLGTLWWTRGKAGRLRVDAACPPGFDMEEHIDWLREEDDR
ncbi:DUF3293 domain-containing protein [Luteimonas lutimaris]|uniref:DUF3293 domain-containing protein n=1 Tax=Luteimonas lutimaris TaxID=698645 RepID=A0ABP7MF71_9GAMM|nr:DUF3293 domain-containing protein [Luteimonas sp.]